MMRPDLTHAMMPPSMRFARLVCVLSVLVAGLSSRVEADVLSRVLAAADPQGGGTAPPQQPPDLSAWAGEARATTLAELLQSAVRQSPGLAAARFDIAIAEARIQQTWGRNDWLLQAKLDGSYSSNVVSGEGSTIDSQIFLNGSADLTRLLATGGSVGIHVGSAYTRLVIPVPDAGDPMTTHNETIKSWTQQIGASLTQPLLRGFGRQIYDANEARATLSRDSAVLGKRLAAIQAVQAVIAAYWDLVLAERSVAITQASLDLARERLRVTQIGSDGGKIPRSEIPAVLQIIATREEDVLNGELTVLDRSIALRRASGMPIGAGELGLRVATDLDTKDEPLELGKLVERAYTASPELAQLARQDASATIDVLVAENGLLPQLDAALTIGPTGTDTTFGGAWRDLSDFNALGINGTLTFSQSLSRDQVRGQVREQREIKRKLTVNAFDIRAQIAQTMTRSVAQLELARRRVVLSQRAIDLANENIKIETDRFNLGKSTNFDVLNRQEDLRQAELRKTQALIDWHKAEIAVQALTGDILPLYGIKVD